jgi:hypothetical protein
MKGLGKEKEEDKHNLEQVMIFTMLFTKLILLHKQQQLA